MKVKKLVIDFIIDKISYIEFLFDSVMKNYRDIFKAGVFLCGLAVAGLSQPYVEIIKMDYETRKLEFNIQTQENKPFRDIDCENISQQKSECLQAQYQRKSNFSIVKTGAALIAFFGIVGYVLVTISLIGFLVSSKDEYNKKKRSKTFREKHEYFPK